VTAPRATRCNRRVARGRLSPAAPSGRGHSDPAAGVWAKRAPSRARTCAHRRARRPRSARARPRRRRRPPSASAAPLVLRRPRHRRRQAPVVLHPLRLRWSRPWRRPLIAPAGPRPPRLRCGRAPTAPRFRPSCPWRARLRLTPRRGLCSRRHHRRRRYRRGPGRPAPSARRCRRACVCRTTPTVVSGGSRPAKPERRRTRVAGLDPQRPRPPLGARAQPQHKAGFSRSRRRIGRRCWSRRAPPSLRDRRRPPSDRGSPRWGLPWRRTTGRSSVTSSNPSIPRMSTGRRPCGGPSGSSRRRRVTMSGRRPSAISGPSSAPAAVAPRGCVACCVATRVWCSWSRTLRPSYHSSPAARSTPTSKTGTPACATAPRSQSATFWRSSTSTVWAPCSP